MAVSPGSASKVALIGDGFPTFSWGAAAGAKRHELVVYRLAAEGEETRPALRETVAGSASSWTPSLDRCLARGGRYAWSVRAVGGKEASEWSQPSLFEVASRPSQAELDEALALVRQYLVTEGGAEAERTAEAAPRSGRGASRSSLDEPAAAVVGPTQLSVDGGVAATSFTGDGSTLTALDPANLAAGTAAIDISGDAATVDGAEAAALEESAEIDAYIMAHAALMNVHHPPTLDTNTNAGTECAAGEYLDGDGACKSIPVDTNTNAAAECAAGEFLDGDGTCRTFADAVASELCTQQLFRYLDQGYGTVLDCHTGLIWLKDASCADLAGTDSEGRGTWDTAQSAAAALADRTCGLTDGSVAEDWRQPTISELCSAWSGSGLAPCPSTAASDSLIDSSLSGAPFVSNAAGTGLWSEGDAFVGVQSSFYRSATEFDANISWGVDLSDGFVLTGLKDSTVFRNAVTGYSFRKLLRRDLVFKGRWLASPASSYRESPTM